jgi:hypothetical protein
MKLIGRNSRGARRSRSPRISITQEEISADLHYPAGRRPVEAAMAARRALGSR